LAMMLKRAVGAEPRADGVVLGGHGLFTWGATQRECYRNTLEMIDQLGQFVLEQVEARGSGLFGGSVRAALPDRRERARDGAAFLRGRLSSRQRWIGHFTDLPEVLRFVNSAEGPALARLGTSCPDHFIRTKIRPLWVDWEPSAGAAGLQERIDLALGAYREE